MIEMMISGDVNEIAYIFHCARDYAAKMTDEKWNIYTCAKLEEIKLLLDKNLMLDMVCMDITHERAVEIAKEIRHSNQKAYMVLIADQSVSPMLYMRPSIKAEGLMMKPLSKRQVEQVLAESFSTFLERFNDNNSQNVFVLESRQGRRLIEYNRILYFESRDKKLSLITDSEELVFYDTLENLVTVLPENFIRCHRSFLVNTIMIKEISFTDNIIFLKNDCVVPMSRSYRKMLKELEL